MSDWSLGMTFLLRSEAAVSEPLTHGKLNAVEQCIESQERGGKPAVVLTCLTTRKLVRLARRSLELEAKVERMRDVLREIADEDWVENCLDPQRAPRIARKCLEDEFPEKRR